MAFARFILILVVVLALWVLSAMGRWRIFSSNGFLGLFSLIPFVNMFIYAKIAGRIKAMVFLLVFSTGACVMGASAAYAMTHLESLSPGVKEKAVMICLLSVALFMVLLFIAYLSFIKGLCRSLGLGNLYFVLFLFVFPLAEFLAGLTVSGGESPVATRKKSGQHTASLSAVLEEDPQAGSSTDYLTIWNSGIVTFRDISGGDS